MRSPLSQLDMLQVRSGGVALPESGGVAPPEPHGGSWRMETETVLYKIGDVFSPSQKKSGSEARKEES